MPTHRLSGSGAPTTMRGTLWAGLNCGAMAARVTLPETSYLQYAYDGAHRLTQISDGLGNRVAYTLDATGNRTREDTYDPVGTLARTRSRTFDSVNRLASDIGAQSQATIFTYDENGNPKTVNDPLNHLTTNSYDALNRLTQVVDPANGTTQYAFDASGNLAQVTDPRNLATSYVYDGLGNQTQLVSPDTGSTTSTYDAAGRLATKQDARGTLATYTYDDLGRVFLETYTGGGSIGYTYDQGTYGKGRLTTVQDAATTTFAYDARGRVTQKTQTVAGVVRTVGYHYDASGRLDQMTYPSGLVVTYGYANGQVVSITAAGQSVLSGAVYAPFGAIKSWTWGNGQAYARGLDLDGRVTSYPRNTNAQTLGFDAAGRVVSLTDSNNATLNQVFGYDALDRLASDTPGTGGTQATRGYTYDATGNRLTATVNGVVTTYATPAASNRLGSLSSGTVYAYDAMGNVTGDGTRTFGYNARGRMSSATVSGQTTTYSINAFGQRVRKVTPTATTIFVYDEGGRPVGEYDGGGNLLAEHVWLDGMPVAVVKIVGGSPKLYQVYPDHLGTPRAVVDPAVAQPAWQWHNVDPFGGNLPNENPAGQAIFKYNLRFPGQYYDAETATHYNYFRDYDPAIGRYEQSDPIGLMGGLNIYAYSNNSPIHRIDPFGLFTFYPPNPILNTIVCDGNGRIIIQVGSGSPCLNDCIEQHEQCHIEDIKRAGGSPCANKPRGTIVTWPGVGSSEIRCGWVEVDCLMKKQQNSSPCDPCQQDWADRINHMFDYGLPTWRPRR